MVGVGQVGGVQGWPARRMMHVCRSGNACQHQILQDGAKYTPPPQSARAAHTPTPTPTLPLPPTLALPGLSQLVVGRSDVTQRAARPQSLLPTPVSVCSPAAPPPLSPPSPPASTVWPSMLHVLLLVRQALCHIMRG